MMHDIGKVGMVNSYPGLYSMLVEELEERGWKSPMIEVESSIAGGLNHAVVGGILGENWGLGDEICRVVRDHHAPGEDDVFSLLVGLANFFGGIASPFPGGAAYASAQAVSAGDSAGAEHFLPRGFFDNLPIVPEDLFNLARLLSPVLRRFSERMRQQRN